MGSLQDVLAAKNLLLKSKNKEIQGLHKIIKLLREELKAMSESFSDSPSWAGKPCCEEAALNAAEVDRLTRERDELQAKLDAAESDRDECKRLAEDMSERYINAESERSTLSVKLDDELAATAELALAPHPTLDREAVKKIVIRESHGNMTDRMDDALTDAIMALAPAEGWPEWMGPAPTREELGEIEVTKSSRGYWAQGVRVAEPETKPEELRLSNIVNDSISSCMRREAVARFIESEQAATGDKEQRVEEAAKELYNMTDKFGVQFEQSNSQYKDWCYAVVKAGWTPPESEASE